MTALSDIDLEELRRRFCADYPDGTYLVLGTDKDPEAGFGRPPAPDFYYWPETADEPEHITMLFGDPGGGMYTTIHFLRYERAYSRAWWDLEWRFLGGPRWGDVTVSSLEVALRRDAYLTAIAEAPPEEAEYSLDPDVRIDRTPMGERLATLERLTRRLKSRDAPLMLRGDASAIRAALALAMQGLIYVRGAALETLLMDVDELLSVYLGEPTDELLREIRATVPRLGDLVHRFEASTARWTTTGSAPQYFRDLIHEAERVAVALLALRVADRWPPEMLD
jgi:hypothetical protein